MFGLGVPELVLILIIGLVVFGPGKLPEIGRALGKSVKEFKEADKEASTPTEAPKPVQAVTLKKPESKDNTAGKA